MVFLQKIKSKYWRFGIFLIILIIISSILFLFIEKKPNYNQLKEKSNSTLIDEENPEISDTEWAWLNLTNIIINKTRHYHNETIPIIGKLFNPIPPPQGIPKVGYNVELIVDGSPHSNYNDITDPSGEFQINYTIPYDTNIYSYINVSAHVTNPDGVVIILNHYIIYSNATSYFDISTNELSKPQLAGGNYKIQGYLRYDNISGILNAPINYYWENASLQKWPNDTIYSGLFDGSIGNIPIPDDGVSDKFTLNLTYFGVENRINSSQKVMFMSVNLYRNITCQWNTIGSATEGDTITIRGRILSGKLPYPQINFTEVRLKFSGQIVGTVFTDSNGNFALSYQIPEGTAGNNIITVEIAQDSSVYSNNAHSISIEEAPVEEDDEIGEEDDETPPPFFNFFLVFIPIVIGVAAGFAIYCVFFLRKQKKESLVVFLPLEGKIRNLKILKDTGRLEESLSYLFNAIYMELVDGKYGRRKKVNETIRDFAIISVKEFKLPPTIIYPFITKVEEYIYSRPFEITDQDFYSIVELFSPIYFELTNYHFVLNF